MVGRNLTQALPLTQGQKQEKWASLGAVLLEAEEEVVEVQPQSLWQMELVVEELEVQQVQQQEGEEAKR